jgi:hypothetical protein
MLILNENQKILDSVSILDTYFMGSDSEELFTRLKNILDHGVKNNNDLDFIEMYHDILIQVEIIVKEFNDSGYFV